MTVSEFFEAFEEAAAASPVPWNVFLDPEVGQYMLRAYDTETFRPGYRCFCPVMAVIHHRDPESDIRTSSSQGDMACKLGMAVRDVADIMQAADADRVKDNGEIVNLFDPDYRAKLLKIAGVEVKCGECGTTTENPHAIDSPLCERCVALQPSGPHYGPPEHIPA